jgi:hypothetical protein
LRRPSRSITDREFVGLEVGRRFDVAVPIDRAEYQRGWSSMAIVVRLPGDVSPDAASQELTPLLQQLVKGAELQIADDRLKAISRSGSRDGSCRC